MSHIDHTHSRVSAREVEANAAPGVKLTLKEIETLEWVVKGKTAWEIARIQGRTEAAVNFHFCNIRRKFGVGTMRAVVIKAIEQEIVVLD